MNFSLLFVCYLYFLINFSSAAECECENHHFNQMEDIRVNTRKSVKSDNFHQIEANIRDKLSNGDNNKDLGEIISQLWNDSGLEEVHIKSYEVSVTSSDKTSPDLLTVVDHNGFVVFQTTGTNIFIPGSKPGTVTSGLVYCGNGSKQEFGYLREKGISVENKIALINLQPSISPYKLVVNAEEAGAVGVILFSSSEDNFTYPHFDNSINSPFRPSRRNWEDIKPLKSQQLPVTIPIITLTNSAAKELFLLEDQSETISDDSRIGYLLEDYNVTIDVHRTTQTRTVQNIIGYITGSVEPDNYVIIGANYDISNLAPLSSLTEIVQSLHRTNNETQWKPTRTIMFVAWHSYTPGHNGIMEFVEDFQHILDQRAVVYIHVDCLPFGEKLRIESTSTLENTLSESAMAIGPNRGGRRPDVRDETLDESRRYTFETSLRHVRTVHLPPLGPNLLNDTAVYNLWLKSLDYTEDGLPDIQSPSGIYQNSVLFNYLGIPSVFITLEDKWKPANFSLDNNQSMNQTIFQKVAVHFWIEVLLRFADLPEVPYLFTKLSDSLISKLPVLKSSIEAMAVKKKFHKLVPRLDDLLTAVQDLQKSITDFLEQQRALSTTCPEYSSANRKRINFERCFITSGPTGSDQQRHILYYFSSSEVDSFLGKFFHIIDQVDKTTNSHKWEELALEMSREIQLLIRSVNCARFTLANYV